jgi:flagellar biosynthesis/type III secretory pathway M-ring protein FliF/YscJ
MPAAVAQLKQEWQQFLHDPPGRRFQNHRARMQQRSRAFSIGLMVLGIVLVVAGVAFLFIPGPGIPVLMFGLALIAGESQRLAALLDRLEPRLRTWMRAARGRWRKLPNLAKAGVVVVGAAAIAAVVFALWRMLA